MRDNMGTDGASYNSAIQNKIEQLKYFGKITGNTKDTENKIKELSHLLQLTNDVTEIFDSGTHKIYLEQGNSTTKSLGSIHNFYQIIDSLKGESYIEKIYSLTQLLGFPGQLLKTHSFNQGSTGMIRITDRNKRNEAQFIFRDIESIGSLELGRIPDNFFGTYCKGNLDSNDHFVLTKKISTGLLNSTTSPISLN